MKIDLCTKLILLSIGIALWGLLLKPIFFSENAKATSSILDVNIREIDGRRVYGSIDVNIEEIDGRKLIDPVLPVKISK